MKRGLFCTGLVILLAFIVGGIAGLIFDWNISGDTWVQYAGGTIGGIATMLGVILTIGEERKLHETEYRPQIRLALSDYYYTDPNHNYYSYFAGTYLPGINKYKSNPDNVVPLQIENFGKSDVFISEIRFSRNGQAATYNNSDKKPAAFSICSQETVDIPFRVNLGDDTRSFLDIEITYRSAKGKTALKKQYSIYIPREDAKTEEAYRSWVSRINIGKARDSVQPQKQA